MKYDKQHFLAKFEAIPEDRWTVESYEDAGTHDDVRGGDTRISQIQLTQIVCSLS